MLGFTQSKRPAGRASLGHAGVGEGYGAAVGFGQQALAWSRHGDALFNLQGNLPQDARHVRALT